MLRVIRNTARVGLPWLLVAGSYRPHAEWKNTGKRRWKTELQISEHLTRKAAEADMRDMKADYEHRMAETRG